MTPDEADKKQEWAGMDGAIAFHLIERHADDWHETGVMMEAWRRANSPAWHDAPTVPGLWLNSISGNARQISTANIDSGAWHKTGARWYGPIPVDAALNVPVCFGRDDCSTQALAACSFAEACGKSADTGDKP